MKKRTLFGMSLALMLGMTTLTAPVWADHSHKQAHPNTGGHKHARGDSAPHRAQYQYAHHDARPGHKWRRQLRRQVRRYRRHLRQQHAVRDHYAKRGHAPYHKNYRYDNYRGGHDDYRRGHHRGGHYGYRFDDRYAYDGRSGLTIIYRDKLY